MKVLFLIVLIFAITGLQDSDGAAIVKREAEGSLAQATDLWSGYLQTFVAIIRKIAQDVSAKTTTEDSHQAFTSALENAHPNLIGLANKIRTEMGEWWSKFNADLKPNP
ncbi:uncharacterized protein LOC135360753 [Latimeria chalumnae]|uniref:uncharacterized protein LOC135360753 n=1 Tax=Latimeria chalumnae TaxID=7897 RepID=UPI00313AE9AE